jgi:hypothetical protein
LRSFHSLCLDGQRLAGISGTYGQNGAEYRTEIESFQRIKSFGSAGSTAAYFTVEHGDGSISYYGESAVECIAPFGQLAFEFSLSLTETNEQLVMWMDGAETANIPLVEELSIRTTLYPAFGQGFLGSWDSTFSEGIASEPVLITILPAQ